MQLNPVSFKYNKDYRDANKIDEVRDYYGFLAQEFKTVFPDDVIQSKESYGNVENVLQLNTSSVEPHIVKAIQEQQKIIEAQQSEIEAQQSEIEAQQSEIEAQQSEIEALKAKVNEMDVLKADNIEMKTEIGNIKSVLELINDK